MRSHVTTSTRILAGAALGLVLATLVLVIALPAPASAHSNGRVQLWVDRLVLHSAGGDNWTVSVSMVDADSGTPQPGFDVAVDGRDDLGHALGPVLLTDGGDGEYTAPLTAAPGPWSVDVRGNTLPGGVPGVPLRKSYPVVLEPGKDVSIDSSAPTGSGSGAGSAPVLMMAVAAAAVAGVLLLARRRRPRVAQAGR
jgi:hypothetical protein